MKRRMQRKERTLTEHVECVVCLIIFKMTNADKPSAVDCSRTGTVEEI